MSVCSNQLGTGTGKTLSFALPVVERFLKSGQLAVHVCYSHDYMYMRAQVCLLTAPLFVNIFSNYSVFVFDDLMFVLESLWVAPDKFHSVR